MMAMQVIDFIFDDNAAPKVIRLHLVRDEVVAV